VSGWLSDLSNTGSPHADALLVNFYRWVCARESLLQDPALHRLVHRLMHKVM
jgi:DNA polymerase epsilon subunit 1